MISTYSGGDQFLRRWSLVVYGGGGGTALELSAGSSSAFGGPASTGPSGEPLAEGLRIKFRTVAADRGVPNHGEFTVYNCSDATAQRVMNKEFSRVVLQAGYVQGKFGVIFDGTIKQVKRGRESAVDTYILIYASDGDYFNTQYAIANPLYMQRASTAQERFKALQDDAVKNAGLQAGPIEGLTGGILPRGKVLWGMGNQNMDTTASPFAQWSIQNGAIQTRPIKGYLPGEAVVLNAHSGLIGTPEATDQGVFAVALLNPAVKVGGLAKINNAGINTSEPAVAATSIQQLGYPGFSDINLVASTSADGTYVILVVEYEGDSRGNPFYMKLAMLLQDTSSGEIAPGVPALPPVGGPTSPGHL
jgi:hypothetical protein